MFKLTIYPRVVLNSGLWLLICIAALLIILSLTACKTASAYSGVPLSSVSTDAAGHTVTNKTANLDVTIGVIDKLASTLQASSTTPSPWAGYTAIGGAILGVVSIGLHALRKQKSGDSLDPGTKPGVSSLA